VHFREAGYRCSLSCSIARDQLKPALADVDTYGFDLHDASSARGWRYADYLTPKNGAGHPISSEADAAPLAGQLDARALSDRSESVVSARRAIESRLVQAQRGKGSLGAAATHCDIAHRRPRFGYQRIHVML
jgi:hypothetical protein